MAKTNFGLVITEARGKAGEVVYSRNRGGAYIRKRPHWIPPPTTDVRAVQATMKYVGALWWNTLTDAQRKAWTALADTILWRDRIGQTNVPIGSALFSQCNFNIVNLGGTAILDPPPALSAIDPGELDCSAIAPATLTVNSAVPLPANYAPLVRATRCLKPGWSSFNKFLRQLGRNGSPPVPVVLPDAGPAWGVKYGNMTPGYKIGIMLQYVNLLTGAISPPQTQLVTVGGTADAMLQKTITITSAQLLVLGDYYIELIPTPGAGFALAPLGIFAVYKYNTTPYDLSYAPNLLLFLATADANVRLPATGLLDQSADTFEFIPAPPFGAPTGPLPDAENLPLMLTTEGGSNMTAGDGTLTITIFYAIAKLT